MFMNNSGLYIVVESKVQRVVVPCCIKIRILYKIALGYACYCSKVGIYYILVQVVNMEDGYGILNSKRNS